MLETGSLSGAARTLGLTQPTIGRHVDELEAAVGFQLFTRSRHGLSPTEAAEELRPYAESLQMTAASLLRTASGHGQRVAGVVRVTASDARSNGADRGIETSLIGALFVVDNQKPRIDDVKVIYPAASARTSDALGVVAEAAFSIDDGTWQLGASQDGLFDDSTEMLKLALPDDLAPGAHTLAIRVADEAGNIGSTSLTFVVQ